MVKKKLIIFVLMVLLSLQTNFVFAQVEDDETSEFSAHGFNVLRVEQEDKLWVPVDKADEVWAFMEKRFVTDQAYIKSIDPEFDSYWYLEEFWDTYYDTPTFQLREMQNGVRHRRRINLSNPEHNKSGRELVQIKLNKLDAEKPLNRGELKYEVEPPAQPVDRDDQHPLLHLVKPEHREDFKARLREQALDPYSLKEVLTVHDMRSRIYITKNKLPFMSISFDRADTGIWWAKYNFVEIEPELNEIPYTEGDAATREYMEKVLGQIVSEIRTEFPFIEQNLTPKYNKSFNALEEQLPFLKFLVKNQMNNTQGLGIILLLIMTPIIIGLHFLSRKIRSRKKGLPPPSVESKT